jgi:hypothetical protein
MKYQTMFDHFDTNLVSYGVERVPLQVMDDVPQQEHDAAQKEQEEELKQGEEQHEEAPKEAA